MHEFLNVLPILLAFFIVTVSPGPANIALATVAMGSGRKCGLAFGYGLSLGLAFWGVIAATGLGVVLQASETGLFLLKLAGGLYLLWLAYQSARSSVQPAKQIEVTPSSGSWFYRGLLLNLSNPKAVVAWMAALSMGLGHGDTGAFLVFSTIVCMMLGFLNYSAYALAFSYSGVMEIYSRFRRWVEGIVSGLFAVAGLGLLKSAFAKS